jgi:hypothetical protein
LSKEDLSILREIVDHAEYLEAALNLGQTPEIRTLMDSTDSNDQLVPLELNGRHLRRVMTFLLQKSTLYSTK